VEWSVTAVLSVGRTGRQRIKTRKLSCKRSFAVAGWEDDEADDDAVWGGGGTAAADAAGSFVIFFLDDEKKKNEEIFRNVHKSNSLSYEI